MILPRTGLWHLKPAAWPAWLGEERADAPRLKALLAPYPAEEMTCWPASGRVAAALCQQSSAYICEQIRRKEFPTRPLAHDPRIEVAVIADPLAILFSVESFAAVKVPVQLWASERAGDGVLPDSVAAVDKTCRQSTSIGWCQTPGISIIFDFNPTTAIDVDHGHYLIRPGISFTFGDPRIPTLERWALTFLSTVSTVGGAG